MTKMQTDQETVRQKDLEAKEKTVYKSGFIHINMYSQGG